MKTYTLYAARTQEQFDKFGAEYDQTVDTIKEGKARAKYVMSREFQLSGEMSEPFGYVELRDQNEQVVWQKWA